MTEITREQALAHFGVKGMRWGYPSGAEITRLDDVDLDLAFLSRWATKR